MSPRGVLTAQVFLSPTRYPNDEAVWRFYREMLTRVRALPGVTAAGMSEELPVSSGFGCTVQGFDEPIVFDRIKQAGMTTCARVRRRRLRDISRRSAYRSCRAVRSWTPTTTTRRAPPWW